VTDTVAVDPLDDPRVKAEIRTIAATLPLVYQRANPAAHGRAMAKRLVAHVKASALSVPRMVIFGAVGMGVGWLANAALMMFKEQGYFVHPGSVATGRGNTFLGSAFWFCSAFVVSAVVSYRMRVGKERFRSELRSLPVTVRGYLRADSDVIAHLLWGLAGALFLARIVGPALAAVITAGAIISLATLVRPVVYALVSGVWRWVGRLVTRGPVRGPSQSAVGVAGLGAGLGTLAGRLTTDQGTRVALIVGAVVGALVLSVRRRRATGIAAPAAAVAVAGLAFALLLGLGVGVAAADDGGWSECRGNVSGCPGTDVLLALGLLGSAATGAGSLLGSIIGDALADEDGWGPGSEDCDCGIPPPTPEQDAAAARIAKHRAEAMALQGALAAEIAAKEKEFKELEDAFEDTAKRAKKELDIVQKIYDDMASSGKEFEETEGFLQLKKMVWEDLTSTSFAKRLGWTAHYAFTHGVPEGVKTTAEFVGNLLPMTGVAIEWWLTSDQKWDGFKDFGGNAKQEFNGWIGQMESAVAEGNEEKIGDLIGTAAGSQAIQEVLGAGLTKAISSGFRTIRGVGEAGHVPTSGAPSTIDAATARSHGTTVAEVERIQDVAKEFPDTVKSMAARSSAEARSTWMTEHADDIALKPEGFYPKTINDIDAKWLGLGDPSLPEGGRGLCAFREPNRPPGLSTDAPPAGTSATEWKDVWTRYADRQKEFSTWSSKMDHAQAEGYHFREGGKQVTYKIDIDKKTGIVKTTDKLVTWEDSVGRSHTRWEKVTGEPSGPLGLRQGERFVGGDMDLLGIEWTDEFLDKVDAMEAARPGSGVREMVKEQAKIQRRLNEHAGIMHPGTANLDPDYFTFKNYTEKTRNFLKGEIERIRQYYEDVPGKDRLNAIVVTKDSICVGRPTKSRPVKKGKRP
jgi:hypothetical protein